MSSNLLRLALLATLSLAVPTHAVVVTDLHEVAVVVPDQSLDQRAKAFRIALAQVVVRLTGDGAAPDAPELALLMRAPQRYIGEFSYADEPAAQDPALPAPSTIQTAKPLATQDHKLPPARTLLRVRFEGDLLARALRDAGRMVWGPERPRTLFWLAIDDGPERDLVGAEDADAFVNAAAIRGLPLIWPALDGDDRAALTLADLTTPDETKVAAASARYPSDAVLAGRAWRAGKGWQGDFLWTMGPDVERFQVVGANLGVLAAAALDRPAASYLVRFGVRNTELPIVVDIALEGVTDIAAYSRAFAYLQGLSVVRKVDLLGALHDVLTVRVTARGEIATLERIIALDRTLQRSSEAPSAGALRYRLAPATAPGSAPPGSAPPGSAPPGRTP